MRKQPLMRPADVEAIQNAEALIAGLAANLSPSNPLSSRIQAVAGQLGEVLRRVPAEQAPQQSEVRTHAWHLDISQAIAHERTS